MKLLLDHCIPERLARALVGHQVSTAAQLQWDRLRNGELLKAAGASGFDAVLTVDQNLEHQQSLSALPVAVIVLRAVSNDIDELNRLVPEVLDSLRSLKPRTLINIPRPT